MQQVEDKSGPVLGYRAVSLINVVLVAVQPILAGQFVTGSDDSWKDMHAGLGQLLHLTVLAALILAFLARRTFGIGIAMLNLVILVLVSIQAVLGFSDSADATAAHIPLGSFILVLAFFAAFLAWFDLRRQRRLEP